MIVTAYNPEKPQCNFCRQKDVPMARLETENPDTEIPIFTNICKFCVMQINTVMRPYLR